MAERDQILAKLLEIRENTKARRDFSYMYTDNGCILGAGRPAAVGKEHIAKDLEFYYNQGMRDFIYEEPVIEVHGDVATCLILFKLANTKGQIYFHGKPKLCIHSNMPLGTESLIMGATYIGNTIVWKRDPANKEWLMYIDMFNEGR